MNGIIHSKHSGIVSGADEPKFAEAKKGLAWIPMLVLLE
jgi:hypothetical protein